MNNMLIENRFVGFSNGDNLQKTVDHIIELSNCQLYKSNPKEYSHLAKFSNDKFDYHTKNKLVMAEIKEVIKETLNFSDTAVSNYESLNPKLGIFANEEARQILFAVIGTAIDKKTVNTEIANSFPVVEVQNLAEGDSGLFHIGSKDVIRFQRTSFGKKNATVQQVFNRDITITPVKRKGTTKVNLHRMYAGTEDLGLLVNKIIKGKELAMSQEIIDLIFETTNLAGNSIYLNTFAQATFQTKLDELSALNDSDQLMAFGVRSALAPVLPDDSNLKQGLGSEIMRNGYWSDLFGVPAMRLRQLAKTGNKNASDNYVIPDNHIAVVATDSDKLVKVCMGGQTRFVKSPDGSTADATHVYTVESEWDMAIASNSHFLLVKTK